LTDPQTYEPFEWDKRISKHECLDGVVTIQDFGLFAKDIIIRLKSGENSKLDTYTSLAIKNLQNITGTIYNFKDWYANNFTVFIADFKPKREVYGVDPIWDYSMELWVTAINTYFGSAYTGS